MNFIIYPGSTESL